MLNGSSHLGVARPGVFAVWLPSCRKPHKGISAESGVSILILCQPCCYGFCVTYCRKDHTLVCIAGKVPTQKIRIHSPDHKTSTFY